MNKKRVRLLTDPAEIAASVEFKRALQRSEHTQPMLAEVLGVSPGLISQWANKRTAITSEHAEKVAALVGSQPEIISADYARDLARLGSAQTARLDPQMMVEALVSVIKAQESQKRQFKPQPIAEALCKAYELRETLPRKLTAKELDGFDTMVNSGFKKAWGESSGNEEATGTDRRDSQGHNKPAANKRKSATG